MLPARRRGGSISTRSWTTPRVCSDISAFPCTVCTILESRNSCSKTARASRDSKAGTRSGWRLPVTKQPQGTARDRPGHGHSVIVISPIIASRFDNLCFVTSTGEDPPTAEFASEQNGPQPFLVTAQHLFEGAGVAIWAMNRIAVSRTCSAVYACSDSKPDRQESPYPDNHIRNRKTRIVQLCYREPLRISSSVAVCHAPPKLPSRAGTESK
jgi:hypothetical protein